MEILDLFKYLILLMNFLIIIFLKSAQNKKKVLEKQKNTKKTILILTAHPDDESMFFLPTILNLQEKGYKIKLLCFSNGNSAKREAELKKVDNYLKLEKTQILDLREKGVKDGMKENWDKKIIFENLEKFLKEDKIDVLVTFDYKGVSGHLNHKALFFSVFENRQLLKNYVKKIFVLESVNFFRKYFLVFDVFFIILKEIFFVIFDYFKGGDSLEGFFVFYNFNFFVNWKCMSLHFSQFVWYRKLFVLFSRYTYVNTLELVDFN